MSAARPLVGCYPGSFDPPTVAHLAVAEAALAAGLHRVDLVISRGALGKDHLDDESVARRAERLEALTRTRPWLGVVVTDRRLVAEIAEGYDAVIMGADKWRQVLDPTWYGPADAIAARDAALARLPRVLVAPRADDPVDDRPGGVELLDVHERHRPVRASDVRAGAPHAADWALPDDEAGSS